MQDEIVKTQIIALYNKYKKIYTVAKEMDMEVSQVRMHIYRYAGNGDLTLYHKEGRVLSQMQQAALTVFSECRNIAETARRLGISYQGAKRKILLLTALGYLTKDKRDFDGQQYSTFLVKEG
jgi:predicted ArsR family transcriptional regulator